MLVSCTSWIGLLLYAGKTYPLVDLLPPDVPQTEVEVLDARGEVLELGLVGALDLVGLADDEIQRQLDAAVGRRRGQPARAARVGVGREAQLVVARLGGGEGEAAGRRAPLGDDAVVVVEDFLLGGRVRKGMGRSGVGFGLTSTEM